MMTVDQGNARLAYYCIPKAGKTALKSTMKHISDDGGSYHNYGDKRFSPLLRWQGRNRFRFTVVRDPVNRLVSAWSDRVGDRDDIRRSAISVMLAKPLGLNPSPDLEEFVLNLRKYALINDRIYRHVIPQTRYIGKQPDFYQAIYSIKQLNTLAAQLSGLVGKEVQIQQLNASRSSKREQPVLSAEALACAQDFYRQDYDLYGRYFEPCKFMKK